MYRGTNSQLLVFRPGRLTIMTLRSILAAMTIDAVSVPREWYKALCSKAGKSVPKATRSRAARESAKAQWDTKRTRYGKTGHASPYAERKLKKAA